MFFKDVIKSPIGNIVVEYSQKGIIKIFLRENIEQTYPLIQLIHWYRFVIDEFHEIHDNNIYN